MIVTDVFPNPIKREQNILKKIEENAVSKRRDIVMKIKLEVGNLISSISSSIKRTKINQRD